MLQKKQTNKRKTPSIAYSSQDLVLTRMVFLIQVQRIKAELWGLCPCHRGRSRLCESLAVEFEPWEVQEEKTQGPLTLKTPLCPDHVGF